MRVIINKKQARELLKQIPNWLNSIRDQDIDIVLYDDADENIVSFVSVEED